MMIDMGYFQQIALRKEINQLKMEKEIIKKASAFFAKELLQDAGLFKNIKHNIPLSIYAV